MGQERSYIISIYVLLFERISINTKYLIMSCGSFIAGDNFNHV